MQIPTENIYFLLCYAWNKLEEKDKIKVDLDDKTQILDLLTKILISGIKNLMKRGTYKSYVETTGEIAGVKGKMQTSETIKGNFLSKQKTVCTFDKFSSNILINQIIVSTIHRLVYTKGLDKELKDDIRSFTTIFLDVTKIDLKSSVFKGIRLNRNNKFYALLINVCEIIYENTLPSEESGKFFFTDFTRDERKMNQLFEAFIRNFYKLEQNKFASVKKENINWKFSCDNGNDRKYLPGMETDITLENEQEKIIIDAKYYKETLSTYYDVEKIKSNNLYQLFSYLLNQEKDDHKTKNAKGILLYPTINVDYNFHYKYNSHEIMIKTVDLNANWKNISLRLKEIIGV